ncbi:MAG TPA: hypothetical protein GX708_00970 [Gallicola sp.]|nr:hypothetical protein [Gallicola sp.]
MLMYNRDNFRDIYTNKPKGLTRQEYAKQISYQPSKSYSKYMSQKAKRVIRIFNDNFRKGITEVAEPRHEKDKAIHIHHIFPENEFPGISAYYENLIALTPTQHLSYAHPNGDTSVIDVSYQHICLLAKSSVIQETIEDSTRHQIYEFKKFTHVLHVGLDDDRFNNIPDGDFDAVNNVINLVYS